MHIPQSRARARYAVIIASIVAGACSRDAELSGAARDSALAKDLALAGQQTSQPTFQDTAIAPASVAATKKREKPAPVPTRAARQPMTTTPKPTATAPAPAPAPTPATVVTAPAAAPAPAPAEIGAGTGFGLTSGSKVCSSSNLPGDKLVATVNETVTGSNGAIIPAGSTVVLEVASITGGSTPDSAQIKFRVRAVVVNGQQYTVSADVSPITPLDKTKVAGTDPNAEKKKVIGGAIAGAILGQIIGHNTKGTVIGAAAGAATGAAVSHSGTRWEGCLPAGAALRLTLNSGLIMS